MSNTFPRVDGVLTVGGMPVDRLAARVGGTPFFAYDRDLLSGRVAALRAALPAEIALSYAVKANPMPAVLHHMSGEVDGFDDYHTSIREQIVLVDQLIEAVRQEERDRCAALADAMRMPPGRN